MSFLFVLPFFFIPGYLITFFLPRVRGFCDRVGFSIATSISLSVVASVIFVVLRLPLAETFFVWNIAVSLLLAIILRKKIPVIIDEWKELKGKGKMFVVLVLFLSVLAGGFISLIHRGYPWAIHADEWWQVGTVQNVIEGRSLNTHPYLFNEFSNDKPGFSSYVAMVSSAAGVDPLEGWQYMPAINVFFISFVGSLFLFSRTKSFFAGMLFPMFLVALRSNAYSLGWWFFVPSMFALFFVLVLFLTSSLWTKHFREFLWACLVCGALALVYFPFAMLSFLCFLPLLFKGVKEKRMKVLIGVGMFFLVFVGVYIAGSISPYREFWRMANDVFFPSFLSQSKIIQAFFVPLSATFHFAGSIGFFKTVPLILLIFSIIGFFLIKKEHGMEGVKSGFLGGVVLLLFGMLTGVSFLVFYQRLFYFVGVIVVVIGIMGVTLITKKIKLWWERERLSPVWGGVVLFFLMATIFLFLFNRYFVLPNGAGLYELVNKDDLTALEWLKENKEKFNGMGVVANQSVGTIITPFTRLSSKVSFLTSQNASALINPGELMVEEEEKCEKKEKILIDLDTKILYAKKPQECSFLEMVYQNPSVFIYFYNAWR